MFKKRLISALSGVLVFSSIFIFLWQAHGAEPDYKALKLFYKVMKTVQKYYVADISETQLINAATQGMLAKATVTKNVRKAIDNIPNQPSKTGTPWLAKLQRFYRAMKLIQSVDPVSDAGAFRRSP